jgi:putative methyltransferase (TIGR04325 family)
MMRAILGAVRDLCTYRYFNDSRRAPRYRGVYSSFQAAEAELPQDKPRGFNLEAVPEYFIQREFMLHPGDYPVLFWLSRILEPESAVFDLGGGFGQSFYSYQELLPFPAGLRWIVCDVESFVRRGTELAGERKATRLSLTSDRRQAEGAQIYLTKGALQYIEPDLGEMVAQLSTKPQHILVNRVPMYDGETYFTLQNSKHSYAVNKVMNEAQFVRGIETLGYNKIDAWTSPRTLHIPFHAERFVHSFKGFYFSRQS